MYAPNYKTKVRSIPTIYSPTVKGSFAKDNDGWIECREVWHEEGSGDGQAKCPKIFFMHHGTLQGKSIAAFIHQAEKRLKLKSRTRFGPTNSEGCTWVRPSPWWKTAIKYSLFTALLRAGMRYEKTQSFEKSLYSVPYTRRTKAAVERFFKGHTQFNYMPLLNQHEYDEYDPYDDRRHALEVGWEYTFDTSYDGRYRDRKKMLKKDLPKLLLVKPRKSRLVKAKARPAARRSSPRSAVSA